MTEYLKKVQQKNTPITLNSIVSSCILQEEVNDEMLMSKLLQKAGMIYEYIKVKQSVVTYMQVLPSQVLVEKHVEALGYQMKNKESRKECKIMISRED